MINGGDEFRVDAEMARSSSSDAHVALKFRRSSVLINIYHFPSLPGGFAYF